MRILFVEPSKDFWFILGQYIPPPFSVAREVYMKYKKSTPMLLPRPSAVLMLIANLLVGKGKAY